MNGGGTRGESGWIGRGWRRMKMRGKNGEGKGGVNVGLGWIGEGMH